MSYIYISYIYYGDIILLEMSYIIINGALYTF